MLRQLAKASRDAKRKKNCAAAAGLDRARNALLTRRTWKWRKVPRKVRKRALPTFGAAEKALIKRGGRRCGTLQRVARAPEPEVGGGGFTPEPGRGTDEIEQGEPEEQLGIGRYRPIHGRGPRRPPVDEPEPGDPPAVQASRRALEPVARRRPADALPDLGRRGSAADGQAPGADDRRRQERRCVHGEHRGGFSLDGGATWTRMDPSTILKDPAGQPLCCDSS